MIGRHHQSNLTDKEMTDGNAVESAPRFVRRISRAVLSCVKWWGRLPSARLCQQPAANSTAETKIVILNEYVIVITTVSHPLTCSGLLDCPTQL